MLTVPFQNDMIADSAGSGDAAVTASWYCDRATIGGNYRITPEGFLEVEARVAVVGVMDYPSGAVFVPAETLENPEWLKGFNAKPIIRLHPTEYGERTDRISKDNYGHLRGEIVGTCSGPGRFEGDAVYVPLLIMEAKAIQDIIDRKLVEVSPAYRAETPDQPGVWNGRPYKRVQVRRFETNHLALPPRGRGGRRVRILLNADAASGAQASQLIETQILPGDSILNPALLALCLALELAGPFETDDAALEALKLKFELVKSEAANAALAKAAALDKLMAAESELYKLKEEAPIKVAELERTRLQIATLMEQVEELREEYEEIEEMVGDALMLGDAEPDVAAMKSKKGAPLKPEAAAKKAGTIKKIQGKFKADAAAKAEKAKKASEAEAAHKAEVEAAAKKMMADAEAAKATEKAKMEADAAAKEAEEATKKGGRQFGAELGGMTADGASTTTNSTGLLDNRSTRAITRRLSNLTSNLGK